ncbi:MAG: hypothetical protein AAF494_04270 [Pseudomonadota bacterium]
MDTPNGARILVSEGKSVRYARNGLSDSEIALFLLGSAWGALCYQRGFLVLHASAVLHESKVHAFCGEPGAGKSTIAAALSDEGLQFFADDVLMVSPSVLDGKETVSGHIGPQGPKLWEDAFGYTRSIKKEPFRNMGRMQKFFADPSSLASTSVGELKSVTLLTNPNEDHLEGSIANMERLRGAHAFKALFDNVYRPEFATTVLGTRAVFRLLELLSNNVAIRKMSRSKRPRTFRDVQHMVKTSVIDQILRDKGRSRSKSLT